MTKYLEESFSTFAVGSATYRDNHDRIFGKKTEEAAPTAPEAESPGSCAPPSLAEVVFWLDTLPDHVIQDWGLNAVPEIADYLRSGEPLPDLT